MRFRLPWCHSERACGFQVTTEFYLTLDADVIAVGEVRLSDLVLGGRGRFINER
jgi:hypothetical protein